VNLYLRLLAFTLLTRRRSRVSPLGPVRTPFRVWPTDLDLLRHVNNGTYLTIMDIARLDLLSRAGIADEIRRRGWYPVVVAETITFRRSLTLFQRFEIRTEVLGWDERSVFLQQDFLRAERVVASAVIRARFLGRDGERVGPLQVLELAGEVGEQPQLPRWVQDWAASTDRRGPVAAPVDEVVPVETAVALETPGEAAPEAPVDAVPEAAADGRERERTAA
jgi:YbgC/YbaW family acyl-CoA thioester hydrolase